MPSQINVGTEGQPIWEELGLPNSIVNMPMERFRFHAGLCSWTERTKTLVIKAGLKKLYGDNLQNNTVRAFGRDLTTKEINEIKKGDNAVFPIEGDVVPATPKAAKKYRSKGAARPTKLKGNAKEDSQSRKRKNTTDDEGQSSEEEVQTQLRSHKRARHGRKEDSVAAEIDDLVMFEQSPTIIDQDNASQRYSLRSTRQDAKTPRRIETIEEPSSESSADEEYQDTPTQRYSLSQTRKVAKARGNSRKVKESLSRETSAEDEDEYVPARPSYPLKWIETNEKPQRESDRVRVALQENSVESDDEEMPAERFPFRRIPRAGEVGGKSKGPSWVSSTGEKDQNNEERDYRHTAVPVTIDGRIHYATYEGLISNGPVPYVGGSGTSPQPQAPEVIGASLAQSEAYPPQPHAFDVMMSMPLLEERHLEEEDTPLQAHRKRVRDFLGDEEAEAYAPASKRLRTEQPVLPNPASATHEATSNFPPQIVSPPIISPQAEQPSTASPAPQAQPPQTRKQKLEAEWALIFKQMFVDLGFQSVNYSEVPPWNEEEVQSLVDALLPTREVYFAWTGEPAPRTDPQQSYRAQFDTIFGAFQDWWRAHRSNEQLPILAGVMHWGRSVDDWELPSKDSMYYEAFKKGRRAPRGENGQILDLPDWPGSRLEDALRERY